MSIDDVQAMKNQLDRIERCLVGDAELGQLGLVARMNNHGGRIKRLELWVYRVAAGGAVGGAVVAFIYKLAVDWWPRR